MKLKIQIKSRWAGLVLFEYEKEDNTVKDTLIEAVKNRAYLGDADLCGANLCDANLRGAYLGNANLGGANLRGADLCGADLCDADLCDADLCGANLCDANLCDANLRDADLCDADLCDANLRGAYLGGANLRGADLCGTNLRGADLGDANLGGANLRDAYLCGTNLRGAKNIPFIPMACPSDGAFIGWKKVGSYLIKLEIPEDAKRSSATGTKCRCDKAKVLDIICIDDNSPLNLSEITNCNYIKTTYKKGEMVFPDSFNEDRWNECTNGIHFFINRQEAVEYNG